MRPSITRQTRRETVSEAAMFFPGITAEAMAGGEGFAASEMLTLSTHNCMRHAHGVDSMPETCENVADQWHVSREDQDRFGLASQEKAAAAQEQWSRPQTMYAA
jgi:acetyl-CoA acetyltransferase